MDQSGKLFSYDNAFFNGQLRLPVGEIIQVSELSVIRNGEISSHYQHCDEITYAISGKAKFISGDTTYDVSAGQIHFIRQNVLHKIEVSPDDNFRFLCIGYIPDLNNDATKALYSLNQTEHFVVNDNGTVKNLAEFLIREFYNYDEFSGDMINQYISQIFITLTRIINGKTHNYHPDQTSSTANFAMYRMLRFIDREYMHITSVKSISEALTYSEYYLSHLFKEKMGITIKEYLSKKKIAHASELLLNSTLTVEQIAEQLGFSSAYAFRRSFKKYTDCSPIEFKNRSTANFVPQNNN